MAKKSPFITTGVVANNRKSNFDYFIEDKIEAGIMLAGTEVKSLRLGHANISDAYASHISDSKHGDGIYLQNFNIPMYGTSPHYQHDPLRIKKLLLHKKEIAKLVGSIQRKGYTLIPLSIYFNERGVAKVELGLGLGKQQHDKRATEKEREWTREKNRLLKE